MGQLTMAWHTFCWLQDYRPGMDAEHLSDFLAAFTGFKSRY